ncbi:MAG: protein translocase subunit SecD [bacterium]
MNRSLQIRAGLVIVVLLLSLWGLIPTFKAASFTAEERAAAKSDSALVDPELMALKGRIDDADSAKIIRRGLDLLGGMYIVLEVDQSDMSGEQAHDALERVREIISNRIDQFGVSEPVIQIQGDNRIIVQLPGLEDSDRARDLIGRTAQLEFRLVRTMEDYESVIRRLDEAFKLGSSDIEAPADSTAENAADTAEAGVVEADADSTAVAESDSSGGEDAVAETESPFGELPPIPTATSEGLDEDDPFVQEHPFSAYIYFEPQLGQGVGTPLFVSAEHYDRIELMVIKDRDGNYRLPESKVIPRDMEFQFNSDPMPLQGGLMVYPLYLVNATPSLTGDRLASARTSPDPDRPGSWQVNMGLDRKGARQFSKVTGDNVGRYLAISLDSKIDCSPVIRSKIPSGQASITGGYTNIEAGDLALLLRAGALPTQVNIAMERTVGPSLGQDSIRRGVSAALYGSLLVVIFIIFYYRLTGFITVAALVSNIIILLAILAQFGLVLTLPGIAGIILTVGMAVDANVLINERIREELRKNKTIRAAVDAGYANATRTIVDANVTTLIVGAILLWFGTGPIKGFAVTLSIGILTSMFTALVMTRVIMELQTRNKAHGKLSI